MNTKTKQYQECNFLEKLWRRRFYLLIPIEGISIWLHNRTDLEFPFDLKNSWGAFSGQHHEVLSWGRARIAVQRFSFGDGPHSPCAESTFFP